MQTFLQLKSRHVNLMQLRLQSHMCRMQHTSLVYSVHMVCAKSIAIYFFRVPLGLIKRFDVLTCDESIFTRVLIVYR